MQWNRPHIGRSIAAILLLWVGLHQASAQVNVPAIKSDTLRRTTLSARLQLLPTAAKEVAIRVQYTHADSLLQWLQRHQLKVAGENHFWRVIDLVLPVQLLPALAKLPFVRFVEPANRQPKEELSVPGFDPSANGIALAATRFTGAHGSGIRVAIKEDRFDTLDIDFSHRFFTTERTSARTTNHASIMASMLGGSGASSATSRGVAPAATLTSTSFTSLLPEPPGFYSTYQVSVQNHSYGVGVESEYGIDAAAYDESVVQLPHLLHVFSAGNSGTQAATTGRYRGIAGWANLTGSFKMSKNSLVVAATDSFNRREIASSRGPAFDGSIKPELSAFGEDGSSGSAALVSGAAAVLQQVLQAQNNTLPSAALVKAILINSSTDVGAEGPDFSEGYGQLNVYNAIRIAAGKQYHTGNIRAGETLRITINQPGNLQRMAVTLCWTDPAATPGSVKAIQNDLQLHLLLPDQTLLHPWVLNGAPQADSLVKPATRGVDSLNVVEHISQLQPQAGEYEAIITAPANMVGTQHFSLVWSSAENNTFTFTHPTAAYHADSRGAVSVRWEHSFDQHQTGQLSVKNLATQSTSIIQQSVELQKNMLVWQPVAQSVYPAQLMMQVGQQIFTSDSFWVHPGIQPQIGYVCGDSVLLFWQQITGATGYRLYHVQNGQMQWLSTTTDTVQSIDRTKLGSQWLAVAPVFEQRQGNRSYGINYSSQQVGCYIQNFTATTIQSRVMLNLQLGSNVGIQRLQFEKISNGVATTIATVNALNSLTFNTTDTQPLSGENYYRIKMTLSNGRVIYSHIETAFIAGNNGVYAYPNPVLQGHVLNILNDVQGEIPVVEMYDMAGRKLSSTRLEGFITNMRTSHLQKGMYLMKISQSGKLLRIQKITVL